MANFINTIQALAFHVSLKIEPNINNRFDYATINKWISGFALQFQDRLTKNGPT